MAKKFIFKLGAFLLVFLGAVSAVLCYGDKSAVNKNEKAVELTLTEIGPAFTKTASADIPIIRIGDKVVYYPEFEFYLLATKRDFEALLGDDVWKVTKNGRSIEELLKTDIIEEIARLKIVVAEAKEQGYTLTEAEEEEIKKTAKEQLKGIDPVLKAKYYLDEELVAGIYMENYLATKFFNGYSAKMGVRKEDAKIYFNEDYNIWESKYAADIYWENIDKIDIKELELEGNIGENH
jgi:hypothetical protein